MSQLAPLEKRTPDDHLRAFRPAFGDNLGKLDAASATHLRSSSRSTPCPITR